MTASSRPVKAEVNYLGELVLTFPRDARLINKLKSLVPSDALHFSSMDKAWIVAPDYLAIALRQFHRWFPDTALTNSEVEFSPEGGDA